MKKFFRKYFRIVWFSLVAMFMIWQWSAYQARGVNERLMVTQTLVSVIEDDDRISFQNRQTAQAEVLFFPGGLVDPEAYVPLARTLSEKGYNVHIIKMPWRMATRGYEKIKTLFNLSDPNKRYILGGHSQGAKMAAQFVYENKGLMTGLFLLGTSHPRDIDMSGFTIPTLKLYAEFDGLASTQEVLQYQNRLPRNTQLKLVEGGNHSQFAYIGKIFLDEPATISREQQHVEVVRHLEDFLQSII